MKIKCFDCILIESEEIDNNGFTEMEFIDLASMYPNEGKSKVFELYHKGYIGGEEACYMVEQFDLCPANKTLREYHERTRINDLLENDLDEIDFF